MTSDEALIELLQRLAARHDAAVYVTNQEISEWPNDALPALKRQGLLQKGKPAQSTVCPGCEQECIMPIHSLSNTDNKFLAFVVCDKRHDINRVPIPLQQIEQWQCSVEAVCGFILQTLEIRPTQASSAIPSSVPLGMFKGKKQRQMLCLDTQQGLTLTIGSHHVPLQELIAFDAGVFRIDSDYISELVDRDDPADPRYTPSIARREARKLDTQDMYLSWQKEYRRITKDFPGKADTWYAKKIAKDSLGMGRSMDTIRKKMVL